MSFLEQAALYVVVVLLCAGMEVSSGYELCKSLSRVWLFETPWTVAHQGLLQARILKWVAITFFWGSSQSGDWSQNSCIAGRLFTVWATTLLSWSHLLPNYNTFNR